MSNKEKIEKIEDWKLKLATLGITATKEMMVKGLLKSESIKTFGNLFFICSIKGTTSLQEAIKILWGNINKYKLSGLKEATELKEDLLNNLDLCRTIPTAKNYLNDQTTKLWFDFSDEILAKEQGVVA